MTLKQLKKDYPELNEIQLTKLLREIDEVVRVARLDELERILDAGLIGKTWDSQMAGAVGQVGRRYQELQTSNSNEG